VVVAVALALAGGAGAGLAVRRGLRLVTGTQDERDRHAESPKDHESLRLPM
jgi:hypothetical protein